MVEINKKTHQIALVGSLLIVIGSGGSRLGRLFLLLFLVLGGFGFRLATLGVQADDLLHARFVELVRRIEILQRILRAALADVRNRVTLPHASDDVLRSVELADGLDVGVEVLGLLAEVLHRRVASASGDGARQVRRLGRLAIGTIALQVSRLMLLGSFFSSGGFGGSTVSILSAIGDRVLRLGLGVFGLLAHIA